MFIEYSDEIALQFGGIVDLDQRVKKKIAVKLVL